MTITRVQLVGNVSTGASFSGIVTATSFSGNVTGNATGLSGTPNITVGNVTGSAATFTNLTSQQLNVTGLSTFAGVTTHTASLFGTQASFTGVVTASNGTLISGIGIRTEGSIVGTGITLIDFRGPGVSTITTPVAGITTVNIAGGGGGLTVSDDTTTNATRYVVFDDVTTGTITNINVSSTKLQFNPSAGNLSATQFTSLSDVTQKTNIQPIENSIELTKQLQGVRFNWIDNNKPSLGLIAQEVEKVLPELVEVGDDDLKRVNYSNMIGLLIEAIKEQQVRIEELERKY
jgi:hypothetical protein